MMAAPLEIIMREYIYIFNDDTGWTDFIKYAGLYTREKTIVTTKMVARKSQMLLISVRNFGI